MISSVEMQKEFDHSDIKYGFKDEDHIQREVGIAEIKELEKSIEALNNVPLSTESLVMSKLGLEDYLEILTIKLFNRILKEQDKNRTNKAISLDTESETVECIVEYFNQIATSQLYTLNDIIKYCDENDLVFVQAKNLKSNNWIEGMDEKFIFDSKSLSSEILNRAKSSIYVICHISDINFDSLLKVDHMFSYMNKSNDFLHVVKAFSSLYLKANDHEKERVSNQVLSALNYRNTKKFDPIYLYSNNSKKLPDINSYEQCDKKVFRRLLN